jgi:hypothetical protein
MKRCPQCNRTYPADTQRFCTHDGGMLTLVDAHPAQPVSEQFADPDAPTKVISRELVPDVTSRFDQFKTTIGDPSERTSEMRGRATADLSQQATPPPPAQQQTSAPLPPRVSQPISQQLGETTSPSMESALPPTQRISGSLPVSSFGPAAASAPPPVPPSPPAQQASGSLPSGSGPIASSPPSFSATMPSSQFTGASQPKQVERLTAPPPAKKSKLPLVLGILAVLFVLGAGVLGVAYVFLFKPMIEARRIAATPTALPQQNPVEAPPNAETTPVQQETATPAENVPPSFTPPANAVQFVNSSDKLDGKLAEHYVDFSFYYPDSWQKDPKSGVAGASNFIEVHRSLPPNFTQESVAVSWYDSAGSFQDDQELFHSYVETKSSQFAQSIGEYRKVSEGPTKVGSYDGYEFRFEGLSQKTEKGQFKIWGRVIWLPSQQNGKNGITLLMLATSLAPELESVADVGEKGELPMTLESFRFGRSTSQ